jgi:hypothetical protein
MKKMKVFAAAAALLLVTAGVFAGSSKFFDTYALYGYNTTVGYKILHDGAVTITGTDEMKVAAAGATPAQISTTTASFYVYYYDVTLGTYKPIQLN